MGEFITDLKCEEISDTSAEERGIWMLTDPLIFKSDITKSFIIIPQGFVTDFASVPRVPFIFALVGDTASRASTLHDWLYNIASGSDVPDRATADYCLKEACKATKIPAYIYLPLYWGVRLFGNPYYKQSDYKKTYASYFKDDVAEFPEDINTSSVKD